MALKHNQQIQKNHFRKDWQRYVRVHFDQPGRKHRRRENRIRKAAAVAPRPVDKLRPIIRAPTIKYNHRVRLGRGFTLEELKGAGISRRYAPTVGIVVDARRQNLSEESLKVNVARLKEYEKRLIVIPRRAGKNKSGDASAADVKKIKKGEGLSSRVTLALPLPEVVAVKEIKKSDVDATENAYTKLRVARSDARLIGVREKRAKAKVDEENAKKK